MLDTLSNAKIFLYIKYFIIKIFYSNSYTLFYLHIRLNELIRRFEEKNYHIV